MLLRNWCFTLHNSPKSISLPTYCSYIHVESYKQWYLFSIWLTWTSYKFEHLHTHHVHLWRILSRVRFQYKYSTFSFGRWWSAAYMRITILWFAKASNKFFFISTNTSSFTTHLYTHPYVASIRTWNEKMKRLNCCVVKNFRLCTHAYYLLIWSN